MKHSYRPVRYTPSRAFIDIRYNLNLFVKALFKCDVWFSSNRKNVEKRTLLDNMDGVFLVVDEIIDGG